MSRSRRAPGTADMSTRCTTTVRSTIDRRDHTGRGHESRSARSAGAGLARYAGPVTALDQALSAIDTWGAEHAAAAVLGPSAVLASRGDDERVFRWASVSKIATA